MKLLTAAEKLRALTYLMGHLDPEEVPIMAEMLGLSVDEVTKKREYRTGGRRRIRGRRLPTSTRVNDQIEDEEREVSGAGLDRARCAVVQLDDFRRVETEPGSEESGSDQGEE